MVNLSFYKFLPPASLPELKAELRALGQETRTERAFAAAAECAYCARERREKNDGTALCREHLAEAMGL